MMWGLIWLLACGGTKNIPKKSDAWLTDHLRDSDSIERQVAMIEELGLRRNPQTIHILIQKANSNEAQIRKASIEALMAFGPMFSDDLRDQEYLHRLEDEDRGVRAMAKKGIAARLESEAQTTLLINSLLKKGGNHQRWTLQMDVLDLLQWIKGTHASDIDALCVNLSTQATNPQVRIKAIQAIATRQIQHARPLLHDIARSDLNEDVRRSAKDSLQQLGGKVNDIVAAVMPFTVQGTDPNNLATGFQHYLSGALSAGEVATIVERGQVDSVMAELVFQDTFINDNQAIQIGQSLRASQVITGTIQFQGNRTTITIKRIDVASNEILSSAQASGLTLDFDALQRDVAAQFVEKF